MEAVSSMSIKLLLLFYQIRYPEKTSVTVLDFRSAKQQMPNGTHDWTRKVCGFSNYAKIRVSRQTHLHRATTICFNLQKTCVRWILMHLRSEFHALLSWTWSEIYNSVRRQYINIFFSLLFSYFFLHEYRKAYYRQNYSLWSMKYE